MIEPTATNNASKQGILECRAPLLIVMALLLPSLVWIITDRNVWGWDPALYGQVSVDLWCSLAEGSHWRKAMLNAFAVKSPGIAWFGQFWVPLGNYIGSIETGLLLSVLMTQFATLLLISSVIRKLFPKRGALSVLGILICVSAPLFVALTHQYFVEPLQMFAVAYFYWLAARSFELNRLSITTHLLIAISLGDAGENHFAFLLFVSGFNRLLEVSEGTVKTK